MRGFLLSLGFFFTLLGGGAFQFYPKQKVLAHPADEEIAWIAKTARFLRYGRGIQNPDELEAFQKLSREALVDHLMEDPDFFHTILDFNIYFLGQSVDSVVQKDKESPEKLIFDEKAFEFQSAIRSAIDLFEGKDYLSLLGWDHRWVIPPLREDVYQPGGLTEEEKKEFQKLDNKGKRLFSLKHYRKAFSELLTWAKENENTPKEQFCSEAADRSNLPFFALSNTGFPLSLGFAAINWGFDLINYCFLDGTEEIDRLRAAERMKKYTLALLNQIPMLDPSEYQVRSLSELRALDSREMNTPAPLHNLSFNFWSSFTNSSTNMNRKRGAYILSRYFCDDLTPIGFVEPDEHSKGRHGSDPACFSCHYKLDPISGFFKDVGIFGFDFASYDYIIFDDNARLIREDYVKQWLSSHPDRKWEVGYIRSVDEPERNQYGEKIDDLFEITREAPEVRACLVERLTDYFLGPEVSVDAGYLSYLTDHFNQVARENSSHALKSVVKKLVLSETFSHPDPLPHQCYDFAPGTQPQNRPPCQVAHLLKENCASCHQSGSRNGLDLSSWTEIKPGEFSFPHLDAEGNQIEKKETFEEILKRLSSPNEDERMPLYRYMKSQDRDRLYLWANEVLEEQSQEER